MYRRYNIRYIHADINSTHAQEKQQRACVMNIEQSMIYTHEKQCQHTETTHRTKQKHKYCCSA